MMADVRKQELIEQYEEAALALLMEEYAEAQGELLWREYEEAVAQGKTEAMPQALKDKCQRLLQKAYKKGRNRSLLRRIFKTCAKVMVVALALFGILSATVLSIEALRVPTLNFILDRGGKFAFVNVGFNDAGLEKQFKAMVKTVEANLPKGYSLEETPDTSGMSLLIRTKNSEGEKLTIHVGRDTAQIKVDTENAQIQEMELEGGKKGYLIYKDGPYIIWHDEEKGLIISVAARKIEPDDFWRLVNALAK